MTESHHAMTHAGRRAADRFAHCDQLGWHVEDRARLREILPQALADAEVLLKHGDVEQRRNAEGLLVYYNALQAGINEVVA